MYYQDLSFYRTGGYNGIFQVYPNVLNIGWLDSENEFSKGQLSLELIQKLKELVFLDIKNQDDIKAGIFDSEKAIVIDQMLVRGNPFKCPFSDEEVISISPDQVKCYTGDRVKVMGLNEICIPSQKVDKVYCCPTLICHYVEKHSYLPPIEFIDALSKFDLKKAYNSNEDRAFDYCVDVPVAEIHNLTHENVVDYPESEDF